MASNTCPLSKCVCVCVDDQSRVELSLPTADSTSDYINASFIKVNAVCLHTNQSFSSKCENITWCSTLHVSVLY